MSSIPEAQRSVLSTPHVPSRFSRVLRNLLGNQGGLTGVFLVTLVFVCAIFAPWISPHDPTAGNILNRLDPPAWMAGGNPTFPLGTDPVGRDLLSRIIFGSRISLYIGLLSTLLSVIIGLPAGLLAGYFGGLVDDVIMRIADVFFAFPFILFAILVLALFGPGVNNLVLVLGISGWAGLARVVRSQVLVLKELDYVKAASTYGATPGGVILRHLLPNVWGIVLVVSTLNIGINILLTSALSFLGLGLDPIIPDWGGMIASGQLYMTTAWWVDAFPGIALMLTVLGFNLVGDWIRDVVDPTMSR
ncbi:MAG: ABC transporter permease [Firmicutes bacterium]|nr:ABC transporter permease [Bacillota bacterium]